MEDGGPEKRPFFRTDGGENLWERLRELVAIQASSGCLPTADARALHPVPPLCDSNRTLAGRELTFSYRPGAVARQVKPSDSSTRIPALGRNGTNQGKHPDSGRWASMLRGRLNVEDAEQSAPFVTQAAPIERTLVALGEPSRARPRTAYLEDAPEPMPDCDLRGQPKPDVELDQRVSW